MRTLSGVIRVGALACLVVLMHASGASSQHIDVPFSDEEFFGEESSYAEESWSIEDTFRHVFSVVETIDWSGATVHKLDAVLSDRLLCGMRQEEVSDLERFRILCENMFEGSDTNRAESMLSILSVSCWRASVAGMIAQRFNVDVDDIDVDVMTTAHALAVAIVSRRVAMPRHFFIATSVENGVVKTLGVVGGFESGHGGLSVTNVWTARELAGYLGQCVDPSLPADISRHVAGRKPLYEFR